MKNVGESIVNHVRNTFKINIIFLMNKKKKMKFWCAVFLEFLQIFNGSFGIGKNQRRLFEILLEENFVSETFFLFRFEEQKIQSKKEPISWSTNTTHIDCN